MNFAPDLATAMRAAMRAALVIEETREEFDEGVEFDSKGDDTLVTVADLRSSEVIRNTIFDEDPGAFILDEEEDKGHFIERPYRFWVVDPLDGTREFIEGNGEYMTMIGLIENGRPVLGVMARPSTGEIFCATKGGGAERVTKYGRNPIRCTNTLSIPAMRSLVSRSRTLEPVTRAHDALNIHIINPCGSAGFKCSRIADGHADLWMLDSGGVSLWDLCASEILLTEAGGKLTDNHGDPIDYGISGTKWPRGLIACSSPILHPQIVDKVGHLLQ